MKQLFLLLLTACALHSQIKSYETFVTETFPPAAALTATGDDYDEDGILNILEFAFGTDATIKNVPNAFQLDVLSDEINFNVERTPGVEAKLTLQFTPDLSTPWQDQESGKEFTAVKDAVSPTVGKDAYTLTLPMAANGFYRFSLSLGNTDFDEDGVLDDFDMDDDNDGVRDYLDAFPYDPTRSSNATPITWSTNVFSLGISVGSQKTVSLPAIASVPLASLWGTDIYTADSSIGRAAVHAGILTIAGGEVTVEYIGNYSPYVGSTQNGISSSSYGNYPGYKFIDLDPDSDEDGTPDSIDTDDDNDGVIDTLDAFPLDPTESADSDSDGVGDNADAFPNDANETNDNDNDGTGDNADTDDDNDGVPDVDDPAPFDETITEGTLISWSAAGSLFGGGYGDIQILVLPATASPSGNVWGTDTYWSISNVGQAAIHAGAITNAGGTIYYRALQSAAASSGTTRNGVSTFGFSGNTAGFEFIDPALDSDDDGTPDVSDAFPNDSTEAADSDEDGVGDNSDAFPNDPTETADNDNDGTGDNADLDDDNDTVPDTDDAFPFDASESADNDGDGTGDNADTDDDNDNVLDVNDAFPFDPTESMDSDSDGTGDNADAFPNDPNEQVDTDGDGIGNNADLDDDGDGIPDVSDGDPLLDVLGTLASSARWQFPLPYGTTTEDMVSIGSITLARSGQSLARSADGGNTWEGSVIDNRTGVLFSDGSSTFYILDGSELLSSTDGLTFTSETVPNGPWTAGAHDQSGRLMLAKTFDSDLIIRYRDNGGAWIEQSFFANWGSQFSVPDKLILRNNQFVAYSDTKGTVGTYDSGTGQYSVLSASKNFNTNNGGTGVRATKVLWDGSQFNAFTTETNFSTRRTPDASGDWIHQTSGGPSFSDIDFNGSTYVISNLLSNSSSSSSDAINWTTHDHDLPLEQVAWDGNRFVASGADGIFATSTTGEQWIQSTSGTTITSDFHFITGYQFGNYGLFGFQFGGSKGIIIPLDDVFITPTPTDQRVTSTTETIYDAFFFDGGGNQQDITIAVGSNGLIRETKNPTITFNVVPPLTSETLRAVSLTSAPFPANPATEVLIVGDNGTVIKGLPKTNQSGFNWELTSINSITTDLNGIGVNGQIRTVVGDGGVILRSQNHGSWTAQSSGTSADLLATNGTVAVGRGGVLQEYTASNWVARSSGTTADLHGVHAHRFSASNTTTVVVGDGVILTAVNDLSSWQLIPLPSAQFRDVYFDQTVFVAVGLDGVFFTSPDGLDWDLVGRLGEIPSTAVSTIFKGNIVTVGGTFNTPTTVVGGPLGSPYAVLTSDISGDLTDLDDNGQILVASGENAWYSTDGLTWADTGINIRCATWDGNRFVGVDTNTVTYASPDGITWTQLNNPAFQQFPEGPKDIIFAEGLYILVSDGTPGTKLRYSTDAVTWTNAAIVNDASEGSTQLHTVAHNGSIFVASRRGFYSFTSDDGITWTRQNTTVDGVAGFYVGDDIDNLGTYFVTSSHSSSDGIDWTPLHAGRGNGFGHSTSVTVVGDQLLITNQDGVTLIDK